MLFFVLEKGVSDAWSGCFAAPSDGTVFSFFSFFPFSPCFRPLGVPLLVEAGGFVEGVRGDCFLLAYLLFLSLLMRCGKGFQFRGYSVLKVYLDMC